MGYASSKFKVGDKVRVLDVGAIQGGRDDYFNGMETEVVGMFRDKYPELLSKDGYPGVYIARDEFHAIEKLDGGDTMNYRTVKRKARVGERILITNAGFSLGHYKNGDVLTVDRTGRLGEYAVELEGIQGGNFHIEEKEYEVIIEEPTQQSRKRVDALESEIETLRGRIATLEKTDKPAVTNVTVNCEGSAQSLSDMAAEFQTYVSRAMKAPKLTPNQQRKATIERAKAFVEENVKSVSNGNWRDSGIALAEECGPLRIDFVVNAEKRTVVALPKLQNIPSHTVSRAKAVAKCNPDDAFNADIGKAIALGRALGLDVSEFEQAVQPTEVVVGMRVDTASSFKTMTIDSSTSIERNLLGADVYESLHGASILDDTGAQY